MVGTYAYVNVDDEFSIRIHIIINHFIDHARERLILIQRPAYLYIGKYSCMV